MAGTGDIAGSNRQKSPPLWNLCSDGEETRNKIKIGKYGAVSGKQEEWKRKNV